MMPSEDWTASHDLAVIYLALAYGTDHDLGDGEMNTVTSALRKWTALPDDIQVQEIVIEAATAFLEGDAQAEVRRSVQQLGDDLTFEERQEALRDLIRIAEADGVLLTREQGLIHFLAEAWSLKQMGQDLLADSPAAVQDVADDWGLIHELAFVYIVVAHGASEDLSTQKIDAALDRLQEWQPDLTTDDVRSVFRRALQVYADGPDKALIQESVEALKTALPSVQRLAVLDDLYTVARADGALTY